MGIFTIEKTDTKTGARAGYFETGHGRIETPVFMPVGTQATVKSLTPQDLKEIGVQIYLNNTYHLFLRPGADFIETYGGLHTFQSWDGPLLTDSGGFQVFSLGLGKKTKGSISHTETFHNVQGKVHEKPQTKVRLASIDDNELGSGMLAKIDNDGVTFQSHIDGSKHRFSPEISIQTQHKLGADIILAFDECAPYPSSEQYAREAMERTHKWAERSLEEHQKLRASSIHRSASRKNKADSLLFGIVQGGTYQNLREASAKFIGNLDFDGICIGGVSVGEPKEAMYQACDWVVPHLPEDKPRHLLGVGEIDDLFEGIERGLDMFDCVTPTRHARNGSVYISPQAGGTVANKFRLSIANAAYKSDHLPIDPTCRCQTCQHFSRAYLRHLFMTNELTYHRLASYHNVYVLVHLVKSIRQAIMQDTFTALKKSWLQ